MNPNVGPIGREPARPAQPTRPLRRRREDEPGPFFDEELSDDGEDPRREHSEQAPEGSSPAREGRPVAPPPPGEAGGELDVTA